MTKPVIFSGPSLLPADRVDPGTDFRPPAAQGDILRLLSNPPMAIGLIDGFFGDRLAIHQKEILEALEMGIPVYGAASMGALRAAELSGFGMVGLGQIYLGYATGTIHSDADVAVGHGPAETGFVATSVSLVDVKATLNHPNVQSCVCEDLRAVIEDAASQIHFLDRTWNRIAELAERQGAAQETLNILQNHHVGQKRQDALCLVRTFSSRTFIPPIIQQTVPRTKAYLTIRKRALERLD